jgi:hypothetical protein
VTGIRLYKSLFFFPFVISQVVVGLIFTWFYAPDFGLLFPRSSRCFTGTEVAVLADERYVDLRRHRGGPLAADRILHDPVPDGSQQHQSGAGRGRAHGQCKGLVHALACHPAAAGARPRSSPWS